MENVSRWCGVREGERENTDIIYLPLVLHGVQHDYPIPTSEGIVAFFKDKKDAFQKHVAQEKEPLALAEEKRKAFQTNEAQGKTPLAMENSLFHNNIVSGKKRKRSAAGQNEESAAKRQKL